jgi:voltage-gated potassium channel
MSWSVLKASDTLRRSRERGARGEGSGRSVRAVLPRCRWTADRPGAGAGPAHRPAPGRGSLPPGTESAFLAIDYLIWAVFAAEYVIKLSLTPNRRQFVAHHIPDLIIVLVPILRPLRVLRSVRLLRLLRLALLAGLAAKGLREARNILRRRGLNWVLLIVLVLNLIAAAMVLEFERGNPDANINSYPDALWWAVTTITTVGYGDRFPMSSAGRGVAVVLMIAGIAMFGVITASIAAYFVEQKAEEDLAGRLDQIMERLDRIETRLPNEDEQLRERARR